MEDIFGLVCFAVFLIAITVGWLRNLKERVKHTRKDHSGKACDLCGSTIKKEQSVAWFDTDTSYRSVEKTICLTCASKVGQQKPSFMIAKESKPTCTNVSQEADTMTTSPNKKSTQHSQSPQVCPTCSASVTDQTHLKEVRLEPIPGRAIAVFLIPIGWSRKDIPGRRQFIPPNVKNVDGFYAAEINVMLALPTSDDVPIPRMEDVKKVLQRSYDSFECLEIRPQKVKGADDSLYVKFNYKSKGVSFTDSQTHALCARQYYQLICTAVASCRSDYEAEFKTVHTSFNIEK